MSPLVLRGTVTAKKCPRGCQDFEKGGSQMPSFITAAYLRGWAGEIEDHQRCYGVNVVVRYSEPARAAWLRSMADALEEVEEKANESAT